MRISCSSTQTHVPVHGLEDAAEGARHTLRRPRRTGRMYTGCVTRCAAVAKRCVTAEWVQRQRTWVMSESSHVDVTPLDSDVTHDVPRVKRVIGDFMQRRFNERRVNGNVE